MVTWLAVFVALAALAGLGVYYRRNQVQERTIRRQMAREASIKARLDDVFERSSDIIVIHDRRGNIATMNTTGEQASGYTREEARSIDASWLFPPVYLSAVERMLAQGADALPRTIRAEIITRKGARIPVEAQARVLVADGQLSGITVVARNVAEREQLETQLRQAQKMEAVGRLATGIAHDFNNLITVLLGYSDELMDAIEHDSPLRRPVEEVQRAVERAAGLTQQLLAFSRRQATRPQRIDVNVTVANMEGLLKRLLGPEIRLAVSLAPDAGLIEADPAQVGQIVMNLAVNARDAMPNGGTLSIRTGNVDLGAEHLDVIPGPHVLIEVSDSGIGMTPDVQRHLFEPFFTTKDAGQGTGLGLSMVYAIVRQSGGHIEVTSVVGKGSTFRVYFPRIEGRQEAGSDATVRPDASAQRKSGIVLFAEDDRAVRRLMSAELQRRGFTVLEASDGAEALEVCTNHDGTIDILVTDVVMPRMNGADLAKAAVRVRPDLSVLFISGHPERAGVGLDPAHPFAANLLMKPFTPDALVDRVNATLDARRSQPHI